MHGYCHGRHISIGFTPQGVLRLSLPSKSSSGLKTHGQNRFLRGGGACDIGRCPRINLETKLIDLGSHPRPPPSRHRLPISLPFGPHQSLMWISIVSMPEPVSHSHHSQPQPPGCCHSHPQPSTAAAHSHRSHAPQPCVRWFHSHPQPPLTRLHSHAQPCGRGPTTTTARFPQPCGCGVLRSAARTALRQ